MSKYVNEQQFIREQMELYTPVISMETLRVAFIEIAPEIEEWLEENETAPFCLEQYVRDGFEQLRQQFLKFIYEKFPCFHIQVVANEHVSMRYDKHAQGFPSKALRCNTRFCLKRDHYETVIIEAMIECFDPTVPETRTYHVAIRIIN